MFATDTVFRYSVLTVLCPTEGTDLNSGFKKEKSKRLRLEDYFEFKPNLCYISQGREREETDLMVAALLDVSFVLNGERR